MTDQQCSYILLEEYMFVLFNYKNNYGTPIYLNASVEEVSTGVTAAVQFCCEESEVYQLWVSRATTELRRKLPHTSLADLDMEPLQIMRGLCIYILIHIMTAEFKFYPIAI